jgi:hypothetical protein
MTDSKTFEAALYSMELTVASVKKRYKQGMISQDEARQKILQAYASLPGTFVDLQLGIIG